MHRLTRIALALLLPILISGISKAADPSTPIVSGNQLNPAPTTPTSSTPANSSPTEVHDIDVDGEHEVSGGDDSTKKTVISDSDQTNKQLNQSAKTAVQTPNPTVSATPDTSGLAAPVVSAPALNHPVAAVTPVAAQVQAPSQIYATTAIADYNNGQQAKALQDVQAGLKADPNNVQLQALDELLQKHVQTPDDAAQLSQQIQSLAGSLKTDGVANPAAQSAVTSGVALGQITPVGSIQMVNPSVGGRQSGSQYINTAWEKAANQKMYLQDYSGAENYLTDIIHSNPANMQAYRIRAEARYYKRDYQGAVEDAQGALNVNSRDVPMLNIVGRALTLMGKPQEALKTYQESLELNSKNARTYTYRALAYKALDKPKQELQDMQQALVYDPSLANDPAFAREYKDALADNGRGSSPVRDHPWWLSLLAGAILMGLVWTISRMKRSYEAAPLAVRRRPPHDIPTPMPMPISLAPGARFGDFEIVRRLGQGGMGIVYEANDMLLGRPVAIKKMREEIAQDPREKARFIKEAQIVASLDHPNIVRIHSVQERPDGLYLIFEYVPGEGLDRIMEREKKLPFADALNYLKPMGAALDYAHRRGIIHRDLKPSNVMVSREEVVKVMDFGIARRVQETMARLTQNDSAMGNGASHSHAATAHGGKATIIGTPLYMAPEQMWGECVKESDIYALGVCTYEMLTGHVPFEGPNPHQQKIDRMYMPITRILHGAPKDLDAILEKAMDPIHAKRYHSAAEFIRALESISSATPVA